MLKTEVLLHIVITLPTRHAQESLHAREARDPAEPRWNWAPGAPSPGTSGSAGPNPSAAGARRPESGGFLASLRQETRASLPHAPLGPTALGDQGNGPDGDKAFVSFSPVVSPSPGPPPTPFHLLPCSGEEITQYPLAVGRKENRSSLGLTFSVCSGKNWPFSLCLWTKCARNG